MFTAKDVQCRAEFKGITHAAAAAELLDQFAHECGISLAAAADLLRTQSHAWDAKQKEMDPDELLAHKVADHLGITRAAAHQLIGQMAKQAADGIPEPDLGPTEVLADADHPAEVVLHPPMVPAPPPADNAPW